MIIKTYCYSSFLWCANTRLPFESLRLKIECYSQSFWKSSPYNNMTWFLIGQILWYWWAWPPYLGLISRYNWHDLKQPRHLLQYHLRGHCQPEPRSQTTRERNKELSNANHLILVNTLTTHSFALLLLQSKNREILHKTYGLRLCLPCMDCHTEWEFVQRSIYLRDLFFPDAKPAFPICLSWGWCLTLRYVFHTCGTRIVGTRPCSVLTNHWRDELGLQENAAKLQWKYMYLTQWKHCLCSREMSPVFTFGMNFQTVLSLMLDWLNYVIPGFTVRFKKLETLWIDSDRSIVYWPVTLKVARCEDASKLQTFFWVSQ